MPKERTEVPIDATPQLELYGFWRSSATFRVRVALHWKGIAVTEHPINLAAGEQRQEEYLALNPMGAVPTLVDQGRVLTQSLAILEYLEDSYPQPPLLPTEPYARAWVRALANLLTADTHPLITPRVMSYLQQQTAWTAEQARAWQTHWFHDGLLAIDRKLMADGLSGDFCYGGEITIADICLASIAATMDALSIALPETRLVAPILSRCQALEAFQRAAPRLQVGAPQ
ncbi:maleylacetoacetate isomerase [Acidithiobacillus sp. IBUN Pt1247-S3]|uniref:maleylacetoacetate isomerase n=1 Tax=Acidithiobacillus sp. IBUN Pt1247-S3 TaxID=3166642 RepID=UPI0034E3FB14